MSRVISVLSITLFLFLIQCTMDPAGTNPEQNSEPGQMLFKLNMSEAPADVAGLSGRLSRDGQDTLFFEFELKDGYATARIEDLAAGVWQLEVDAWNAEGTVIYNGSTAVTVEPGIVTQVYLNLNPTTGSLEIVVTWGEKTIRDIDGNVYRIVLIGNQIWMAENLKVTHYRNGDPILDGTNIGDYSQELEPKYRFSYNDDDTNIDTYGLLYTWYVVNDPRSICPIGWHIPTDADFRELEVYLGMSTADSQLVCSLNNDISGKLKETGTEHWIALNAGATNESGFNALPAGYRRRFEKDFDYLGQFACFWTSTEKNGNNAWYRHLYADTAGICRTYNLKNYGFSVRLIKNRP